HRRHDARRARAGLRRRVQGLLRMRILHMIGLATALFALAACDGGSSNDDPAGLLTESDLSAKVEAQSTATQPPPLTPWCSLEFGGIFGPGFDIEGRSFET